MPVLYQIRKEMQKESDQQKTDVHSINISIGSEHNAAVAQVFKIIFNIKSTLEKVEFLIFIHHFLGHSIAIQGLAFQAEYRLGIDISRLGNRSARRISFGYKESRFQT